MTKRGKGRSAVAEENVRQYRAKVAEMLSTLRRLVDDAPGEMKFPRESIHGLLLAADYLLDIKFKVYIEGDEDQIRLVIGALEQALGPLGLGLDYWDRTKANQLRRDIEAGENSI